MVSKSDVISFVESELEVLGYDDDNFLFVVSTYLNSLEYKEPILELMPLIKKGIKNLENKFDGTFLLVRASGFDSLFLERQNLDLINSLDFLIEILDKFNFHFEAEKLNHIKSKLHLGYDRYFNFEKLGKLVEWFSPIDLEFEIYTELDLDSEVDVLRLLSSYLDVKNVKEFKKFLITLKNFPTKIYRGDNLGVLDIQESLFFDENFESLEFSKGKVKTCDFGSIDVAVKILEIMNLNKFKD